MARDTDGAEQLHEFKNSAKTSEQAWQAILPMVARDPLSGIFSAIESESTVLKRLRNLLNDGLFLTNRGVFQPYNL